METKVPKVVTRMAEVMKKLPGLEKNKTAPKKGNFGGWAYRGIDDLLDTLHPLLVEAKLNITPRILPDKSEVQYHSERNTPYVAIVYVEYEFQSTEDGSTKVVGPVLGTGADSMDKMAGKAMTSAFKNAMYQTFCVPVGDSSLDPETSAEDGPAGNVNDGLQQKPRDDYGNEIPTAKPPPEKSTEESKDDRHRRELHSIASQMSLGDIDVYSGYIKDWTVYVGKDKDNKDVERYCTKASDTYNDGAFILKGKRLNIALTKARAAMEAMKGASHD